MRRGDRSVSDDRSMKPEFLTNRPDATVADGISGYINWLQENRQSFELSIATAYLNPGGHALLADQLDQVQSTRLLIGASPEAPVNKIRPLSDTFERDPLMAEESA